MDYSLPTEFDLIVVGTGVIESIVSAAASRIGKRVLHVDINAYYGGHWASFNLEDIQKFKDENQTCEVEKISLAESENNVIKLGNKLKYLPHFHTQWHVFGGDTLTENQDSEVKSVETIKDVTSNKEENTDDSTYHCNTVDKLQRDENNSSDNIEGKHETEEKKQHVDVITQEKLKNDYRKFVIDLCPKLHFARGDFVELLISSNIARYSEFRSVSRVLTWINGTIEVVPCSRSDVFANNRVSVVEKRMLMKLLTSIEEDEKNTNVSESTLYKDLLKAKKLSDNIVHFVLYALSMSTDKTLWMDGVRNIKRFLTSLGRFGKTPFLFSMYGSGEITQAFCRLSAVFGGIFALNQPLHGIELDENNKFVTLLCGNQKISASHLVMDVGMAPEKFLNNCEEKFISRAIFITDKSLMYSENEHLSLLLYPSGDRLCKVLELGTLTGTCPKNLFLVHITTKGNSSPQEDLKDCVNDLFTFKEIDSQQCAKPRILWSCYISIPDTNEIDLKSCVPTNIFLCPGPDLDLDYDYSVKKAKGIFSEMYPDEDFLPRAPDADEIVIENDTEIATEVKIDDTVGDCVETETTVDNLASSVTEVAVEVRPSNSDLQNSDESKHASDATEVKVDECSEAEELSNRI